LRTLTRSLNNRRTTIHDKSTQNGAAKLETVALKEKLVIGEQEPGDPRGISLQVHEEQGCARHSAAAANPYRFLNSSNDQKLFSSIT